jgi:E3 ubiquitin-protein ligase TRIP12
MINLVSVQRRQGMLLEAFSRKAKSMHPQSPFSVFVKKLQESLTRMEPYEVVTIVQGVDGVLNPRTMSYFLR